MFPPIPMLNTPQTAIIGVTGYDAESHKVVTEDGYVLTIYTGRKKRKIQARASSLIVNDSSRRILGVRDGPPVFLQHGVEGSSALW